METRISLCCVLLCSPELVWIVCVCVRARARVCIPVSSYTDSLPARGASDQKYSSNLSLKERLTGLAAA